LQQTEKKRREILLYGDDPLWRIMTRYNGSVMPILLTDLQLYVTMAVYVVVRGLIHSKREIFPTYLAELVQGQITVVGGFIRYVVITMIICSVSKQSEGLNVKVDLCGCFGTIEQTTLIAFLVVPSL
jgi:hypothetical protein